METTTNHETADENLGPAQIFERTRDQLRAWSTAQRDALLDRKEALLDRKDELLRQKDEAARTGRETLLGLEATALEGARDLLARAEDLVGPNARFLARGRAALDDAIVTVRSAYEGGLAIADYDELAISKIVPQLDDLGAPQIKTIRTYEAANKNRKTLLRELDARLAGFAPADTEAADA